MPTHSINELVERAEARIRSLAERPPPLPFRYWRQQAHFTTPASDPSMAVKAVERGTESVGKTLERWAITPSILASRLGLPSRQVEDLLAAPRRAPLVMLDGEDAQALREDVAERGLTTAVNVLREADWGTCLRFYRPPGANLPGAARTLVSILYEAGQGRIPAEYPLDGIIFPKIERLEELTWVMQTLSDVEAELGLPPNRIRLGLLIESGGAVARLEALVEQSLPRLCALIFGLVDYAADLGLTAINTRHPIAEWARAAIINAAGAAGVPAIDSMTIDYPVADPGLSEDANRKRILERIALAYEDARHGLELGMSGKWVGHPVQLFAVLLAFEAWVDDATLEREAAKLRAYRVAEEQEGRGATIIDGVMSDRATDRQAREVLRRAVAWGRFDQDEALKLGVITPEEVEMQ
jgi:citrate lyase beta subunit